MVSIATGLSRTTACDCPTLTVALAKTQTTLPKELTARIPELARSSGMKMRMLAGGGSRANAKIESAKWTARTGAAIPKEKTKRKRRSERIARGKNGIGRRQNGNEQKRSGIQSRNAKNASNVSVRPVGERKNGRIGSPMIGRNRARSQKKR